MTDSWCSCDHVCDVEKPSLDEEQLMQGCKSEVESPQMEVLWKGVWSLASAD